MLLNRIGNSGKASTSRDTARAKRH